MPQRYSKKNKWLSVLGSNYSSTKTKPFNCVFFCIVTCFGHKSLFLKPRYLNTKTQEPQQESQQKVSKKNHTIFFAPKNSPKFRQPRHRLKSCIVRPVKELQSADASGRSGFWHNLNLEKKKPVTVSPQPPPPKKKGHYILVLANRVLIITSFFF